MFFRTGLLVSRSRWTSQCAAYFVHFYHPRTPPSWRLELQRLDSIIQQQSRHGEKSRSGKLKHFHRVLLQKPAVVQRVEAATAEQSMQAAEKMDSTDVSCNPCSQSAPTQFHRLQHLSPLGFLPHPVGRAVKQVKSLHCAILLQAAGPCFRRR